VQPVDQPGPLEVAGQADVPRPAPEASPPSESTDVVAVSPTVAETVRPVAEEGFQNPRRGAAQANGAGNDDGAPPGPSTPSTQPVATIRPFRTLPGTAAPEPTELVGTVQLVGTVLADVNSAPIFADKVLAVLDKALAAEARKLDEPQFRRAAADLITSQVREYIANELEFALAYSRLGSRDKELAQAAAIKWREDQITQAGGSLEVAKQQWAAKGLDFEDQAAEQFRTYMVQLYYQRKEYPKVQVSAEDKRRYYQENLAREFSNPQRAKFRVIMVDKRRAGGRQAALGEINRQLDRARSGGTDFAELANRETNDNPSFRRPAGWVERNAFVVPEVEQAVWNLQPGKITDIIETPDGFYIAWLDEVEAGGTLPFTNPVVQRRIEQTLSKRQFEALRQRAQQRLIRDAIIRFHPDEEGMLRTAVEMAVQKYRYWRTARS
jgi:parvulin-like peptidyl-prolyl isomerase